MNATLKNAQALGGSAPAPLETRKDLAPQMPAPLEPARNTMPKIDRYKAKSTLPKAIPASPQLDAAFVKAKAPQHNTTKFNEALNNAIALHLSQSAPELAKEILEKSSEEHSSSESQALFEHIGLIAKIKTMEGSKEPQARQEFLITEIQKRLPAFTLKAGQTVYKNSENVAVGSIEALFVHDTEVGYLESQKLSQIRQEMKNLSAEQKQQISILLFHLSQACCEQKDVSDANMLGQILQCFDRVDQTPLTLYLHYQVSAHYQHLIGNDKTSLSLLQRSCIQANKLQDRGLLYRAQFHYASALHRYAATGDDYRLRQYAATSLSRVRQELKADKTFPREAYARLIVLEIDAHMHTNHSAKAQKAMGMLRSYQDIPWVAKTCTSYTKNLSQGSSEAAFKVALRELNSESMGEALTYGGGGALAGAGVAAAITWWTGPLSLPAIGLGALIGGAIGTGAVKGRNLYRGFDEILEAYDTGMSNLSWQDAALDGTCLALDGLAIFAPIKGAGALGRGGIKALIQGGRSRMGQNIMLRLMHESGDEWLKLVQKVGRQGAQKQLVNLNRDLILREMNRQILHFGGKATPVLAGGMLGQTAMAFAREWQSVEKMPEKTETDIAAKEQARKRFREQLGSIMVIIASGAAVARYSAKAATNSSAADKNLRAALKKIENGDGLNQIKRGEFLRESDLHPSARLDAIRFRDALSLFSDPKAKAAVLMFLRGDIHTSTGKPLGQSVKKLKLSGKNGLEIDRYLTGRGFKKHSRVLRMDGELILDAHGQPAPHHIYLHPDGGMVRVKPIGDPSSTNPTRIASHPHVVKAVRYPPSASHAWKHESFKVDGQGRPIPRTPIEADLRRPGDLSVTAGHSFADSWAWSAHDLVTP